MPNEQTNTTDTQGKETSPALASDGTILSDYDKALALVERREKATEEERKILEEKKELAANQMIGGTTGGNIETIPKEETPQDYAKRVMSGDAGND